MKKRDSWNLKKTEYANPMIVQTAPVHNPTINVDFTDGIKDLILNTRPKEENVMPVPTFEDVNALYTIPINGEIKNRIISRITIVKTTYSVKPLIFFRGFFMLDESPFAFEDFCSRMQ